MSNDENHGQAHMTLMARKISGVFATSFFFHFGPSTYFISHCCCGRVLHAVFYRWHFFLVEHSCLTTGHTYVAWCAWCWHHVYVLPVRFALAHLKIHFWPILDPRSLLDPCSILLFQESLSRQGLLGKLKLPIIYSTCYLISLCLLPDQELAGVELNADPDYFRVVVVSVVPL